MKTRIKTNTPIALCLVSFIAGIFVAQFVGESAAAVPRETQTATSSPIADNSNDVRELGMTYRPLSDSIGDMFQ